MSAGDRRRQQRRADVARAELLAVGAWPVLTTLIEDGALVRFETVGEHGVVDVEVADGGAWRYGPDRRRARDARELAELVGLRRLTFGGRVRPPW